MKCPACNFPRTQTKGNRYLKSDPPPYWRRTNWRRCPNCKSTFTVDTKVVAIRQHHLLT